MFAWQVTDHRVY